MTIRRLNLLHLARTDTQFKQVPYRLPAHLHAKATVECAPPRVNPAKVRCGLHACRSCVSVTPLNRIVFRFNDVVGRYALVPLGKGYARVVPDAVDRHVDNFFSNAAATVFGVMGWLGIPLDLMTFYHDLWTSVRPATSSKLFRQPHRPVAPLFC
jgi:MlaA lipoprotein